MPFKKQAWKLRPLSIPAMQCRAQQALHLLALEPIVETMADKNAYGFRPYRSTADAIEQCFKVLARKSSAQFIFEGDIQNCFDAISHPWLLKNIPMDKAMLAKWLKTGYMENEIVFPTNDGVPQGGLISPALLTITLSGLETLLEKITAQRDRVHLCTYDDDFIITGATLEVLEKTVRPALDSFLLERGLALSPLQIDAPDWNGLKSKQLMRLRSACEQRIKSCTRKNQNPLLETTVLYVLLGTGLRESELVSLNVYQYYNKGLHDVVRHKSKRVTGKVPVPQEARDFLDKYLAERARIRSVFIYRSLWRKVKNARYI